MKIGLWKLYLLSLTSYGLAVIMEPKNPHALNGGNSLSFNEAFGVCMAKKEHGAFECVNRGALSTLQSLNEKDDLDFGEVRFERADGYARDLLDLDYDPKDFGNVVNAAARLMERRNMKWNLDNFYPGLQMRVGPMLNGDGVLEFVLNERTASYGERQGGTGRQLARHLLLPFLLGFKFNLASLIPLLFGVIVLVTKKALLLSKAALLISGLLGWNSMYNGAANPSAIPLSGFGYGYDGQVGGFQHPQFPYRPYRTAVGSEFAPYGQHVIREVVDVFEGAEEAGQNSRNKNFAWTSND